MANATSKNKPVKEYNSTYSKPFLWINFNHATKQVLAIRWNKVWDVKYSTFHFLQQLTQVVIIKW
jgi:hypothetical protein